jgi:DNA-binding NarL/FixJ family response regulator
MKGSRIRVLVTDDDPQFLRFAAAILEKAEIDCDTAGSVEIAREKLSSGRYTLLVADIHMPGNHDLAFVRRLASERPDLPVLIVTGQPTLDTAIGSANLNVASYLVKPFTNRNFELAVRAASVRAEMLEVMEKTLRASPRPSPLGIDEFVSLTASNILESLEDLKRLADGLSVGEGTRAACHLFDCPRLAHLTDAVMDAIAVLERTKGAFKSKELGDLRKRLESVVERERVPSPK